MSNQQSSIGCNGVLHRVRHADVLQRGGLLARPRPGRATCAPALWLWLPRCGGGSGSVQLVGAAGFAEIGERPGGDVHLTGVLS